MTFPSLSSSASFSAASGGVPTLFLPKWGLLTVESLTTSVSSSPTSETYTFRYWPVKVDSLEQLQEGLRIQELEPIQNGVKVAAEATVEAAEIDEISAPLSKAAAPSAKPAATSPSPVRACKSYQTWQLHTSDPLTCYHACHDDSLSHSSTIRYFSYGTQNGQLHLFSLDSNPSVPLYTIPTGLTPLTSVISLIQPSQASLFAYSSKWPTLLHYSLPTGNWLQQIALPRLPTFLHLKAFHTLDSTFEWILIHEQLPIYTLSFPSPIELTDNSVLPLSIKAKKLKKLAATLSGTICGYHCLEPYFVIWNSQSGWALWSLSTSTSTGLKVSTSKSNPPDVCYPDHPNQFIQAMRILSSTSISSYGPPLLVSLANHSTDLFLSALEIWTRPTSSPIYEIQLHLELSSKGSLLTQSLSFASPTLFTTAVWYHGLLPNQPHLIPLDFPISNIGQTYTLNLTHISNHIHSSNYLSTDPTSHTPSQLIWALPFFSNSSIYTITSQKMSNVKDTSIQKPSKKLKTTIPLSSSIGSTHTQIVDKYEPEPSAVSTTIPMTLIKQNGKLDSHPHSSTPLASHEDPSLVYEKTTTLLNLIQQALLSNDKNLLDQIFDTQDKQVIQMTISQLPSHLAAPLLEQGIQRIQCQAMRAYSLSPWFQALVMEHASYLAHTAQGLQTLQTLYQTINLRLQAQPSLIKLQGRVDLLIHQISTRAKRKQTQSIEVSKSFPLIEHIQGQS